MRGMTALRRLGAAALAAGALLALGAASAAADPVSRVAAGADAPLSQMQPVDRVAVPGGGEIQRYRQRVEGLPVLGGEAVVADPPGAPPILVTDHTVAGLDARGGVEIGRPEAISRAMRTTAASGLRAPTTAGTVVDPASGSVVWRVLIASGRPLGDYEVLVDAADGSIVRVTDMLHRLTGSALLFAPTPVAQQDSYSGLADRNDKDSQLLTNLRVPVTLERLTSARGCLQGQYANVGLGRERKPVCAPVADFNRFTRHSDKFEAAMAYYWIDRTRAYLDGLGVTGALSPQPQKVSANAIADDNSYFSPRTRSVTYGTGGVDDAEDGDVVVHEYGHSVQDQQVHFFGSRLQGASMGEGWGDYLAAVMSAQATGGDARFDPCMFEWDATSYTNNDCARRTNKPIGLEAADHKCQGDPHCLGEVWSGALWTLRAQLGLDPAGRSIADRVVLESHFMLSRNSNFRDGARALLAADQTLYGGIHATQITTELIQRDLCPPSGC
jgi:Fungalysin metallopeptidase (M36)/Fungalysin/Thermolysin Propeptide Motif